MSSFPNPKQTARHFPTFQHCTSSENKGNFQKLKMTIFGPVTLQQFQVKFSNVYETTKKNIILELQLQDMKSHLMLCYYY
jgi:hypothetical protein